MDRSDRDLDRQDPDEARGTDVQTEESAERQGTPGQYGVNLDGDAPKHDKPDSGPDLGREPDRDSLDQHGKEPPGPVSIGDEPATAEAAPTGVVATPGSAPATSAAETSVTAMRIGEAEAGVTGDDGERVLAEDKVREFIARWEGVQLAFLDSPSQAVRDADRLVTELLDHVTARLDERRSALEDHWNGDTETNTENLRVTLQQYRDFFRRLIAS